MFSERESFLFIKGAKSNVKIKIIEHGIGGESFHPTSNPPPERSKRTWKGFGIVAGLEYTSLL